MNRAAVPNPAEMRAIRAFLESANVIAAFAEDSENKNLSIAWERFFYIRLCPNVYWKAIRRVGKRFLTRGTHRSRLSCIPPGRHCGQSLDVVLKGLSP